ncbi:unnamed protein product [Closterium sp. Yama58-4]|nr:unnamed protein product [Closterium sp. Yama58-4]
MQVILVSATILPESELLLRRFAPRGDMLIVQTSSSDKPLGDMLIIQPSSSDKPLGNYPLLPIVLHMHYLPREGVPSFRRASLRWVVLVSTNVAARGVDIPNLPFVVNFDPPGSPQEYLHRIGRTGRAGASGTAISFLEPQNEESPSGKRALATESQQGGRMQEESSQEDDMPDAPGSPWALPSSPAAPQKLELDETTLHNRVEVEQGAAEQTGPTDHHPPHPRSRPQQATVDQDARGSPRDHAAGGQRVEQREQVDARDETTIPPLYDEWLLPCRPASGARAPSRTAPVAPPRHGHSLHGAHGAHSHSTVREIAGEIARVGAVAQGIGPRDEESEAAGVLTAATNAQRGIGDERWDDEVIAAASNGEQGTGGGASNDLGTGSAIPRAEANAAERATEISRGDRRGGSPAPPRASPTSGAEATAPGAPLPPRRSVRRVPRAPDL